MRSCPILYLMNFLSQDSWNMVVKGPRPMELCHGQWEQSIGPDLYPLLLQLSYRELGIFSLDKKRHNRELTTGSSAWQVSQKESWNKFLKSNETYRSWWWASPMQACWMWPHIHILLTPGQSAQCLLQPDWAKPAAEWPKWRWCRAAVWGAQEPCLQPPHPAVSKPCNSFLDIRRRKDIGESLDDKT